MAKTKKVKDVVAVAEEAAASVEKAVAKTRGPRGVPESAVITVNEVAPKKAGSKAAAVYALYRTGMTLKEVLDLGESTEGVDKSYVTPCLVYDAKRRFITIEGYDPGEEVVRKERKAAVPKEPKAKKVKAEKLPKSDEQLAADSEAQEESMS